MNIIDKIKKIFIKNKENINNTSTNLSLYDISDVYLPSINELNRSQKELFLKYKKEINLNNLESILKYNENLSKEGEILANLLIKILYQLNEVIRKDDKKEEELQEIDINNSIKNMEIIVIRELLYNLKNDCRLRTLSVKSKRKDMENKNPKFIEIFSHAARIKRNMELRSLIEAENRCKITIKTITQQIGAIESAIISNNIYKNKIDIYNKLTNTINKEKIRNYIYCEKLEFYIKVKKILKCKFSKLFVITNLLINSLDKDIEQKLLEDFSICELELNKFIIENKDKYIDNFLRKIRELDSTNITCENKDELLKEIERLQFIAKVFKDYIDEKYIEKLCNKRFDILSFDINNQIDNETKFNFNIPSSDIKYYVQIISNRINNINQGISPVARKLQENHLLKKTVNSLNSYFKGFDGNYKYIDILCNRKLLALLLAFDSEEKFNKFFKEYKYPTNGMVVSDCINLPYMNFEWDKSLPLETIYTLYEVDGKDKPPVYDIYKYYHKIKKAYNFTDSYYYLPEGLQAIYNTGGDKELLSYIKKKSDNKVVVLPSTLKTISGAIFGDSEIRNVILKDGLEYIGSYVFLGQKLRSITFPSSVSIVENFAFNFKELKELVFDDTIKSKMIKKRIFQFGYNEDYRKVINSKIEKIILCDKEDGNIEFKRDELFDAIYYVSNNIDKVKHNLAYLIEQKTGVNIREYHDGKIKQK